MSTEKSTKFCHFSLFVEKSSFVLGLCKKLFNFSNSDIFSKKILTVQYFVSNFPRLSSLKIQENSFCISQKLELRSSCRLWPSFLVIYHSFDDNYTSVGKAADPSLHHRTTEKFSLNAR